ncbi:MAG: hypothetical protein K6E69_02515 [Treponema sp.]|uniref:hypothetical protein n=1 Tax=Treponema sp. TaxID=166 RepID=UPI00298E92D0|nr:hypothetical protein [Treponema sp.]MCR5385972.1 hypothetical protein [Treponema sp.]
MNKKIVLFIAMLPLFSVFAGTKKDSLVLAKKNVMVEYVPYNSGVLLYYSDPNDKAYAKVPVIDTLDYANSSYIGIAVDKRFYNVHNTSGITYSYSNDGDTLTVNYQIKKQILLSVEYTISSKNILSIKYHVKNIDSDAHSVMLKSVFDTIFEEFNGGFYSTESKKKIKSEYIISDFDRHQYIESSNKVVSIRFLLDENFSKYAYKAVVAAKPYFESDIFEGRFVEGRGFNTVLSYNNSAIGFFFKTLKLNAGEEKTFVQRILFSKTEFAFPDDLDEEPEQNVFVDGESDSENETQSAVTKFVPVDNAADYKPDVPSAVEEDDEEETVDVKTEVKTPVSVSKPEQDNAVTEARRNALKKEASSLIDRIEKLDDDGANTDQAEVMRLQAQLDQILRQLKEFK